MTADRCRPAGPRAAHHHVAHARTPSAARWKTGPDDLGRYDRGRLRAPPPARRPRPAEVLWNGAMGRPAAALYEARLATASRIRPPDRRRGGPADPSRVGYSWAATPARPEPPVAKLSPRMPGTGRPASPSPGRGEAMALRRRLRSTTLGRTFYGWVAAMSGAQKENGGNRLPARLRRAGRRMRGTPMRHLGSTVEGTARLESGAHGWRRRSDRRAGPGWRPSRATRAAGSNNAQVEMRRRRAVSDLCFSQASRTRRRRLRGAASCGGGDESAIGHVAFPD